MECDLSRCQEMVGILEQYPKEGFFEELHHSQDWLQSLVVGNLRAVVESVDGPLQNTKIKTCNR